MDPLREIILETSNNTETLLKNKEEGDTFSCNIERIQNTIWSCTIEESIKEWERISDVISEGMKYVGIDFSKAKESLQRA